jgi:hypothetical protein
MRFLATRREIGSPTKRSYACSCAGRSSRGARYAELESVDIPEKLRNEQALIESDDASELRKFRLAVSHARFVFRGDVPATVSTKRTLPAISYLPAAAYVRELDAPPHTDALKSLPLAVAYGLTFARRAGAGAVPRRADCFALSRRRQSEVRKPVTRQHVGIVDRPARKGMLPAEPKRLSLTSRAP